MSRHNPESERPIPDVNRDVVERHHHVTLLAAEHDPAEAHGTLRWRIHDGLPVVELVNNWTFGTFEETYASQTKGHF